MNPKRTVLSNGLIVLQQEILQGHAVVLCGEKIEDIVPVEQTPHLEDISEYIDCSGLYIIPGLIDIHSDMVENIIVPRKGLVFSNEIALHEADRQLIGHGITTIFIPFLLQTPLFATEKEHFQFPK